MAEKFQKPRGTQDYYPEEKAQQNWIVGKLLEVGRNYGFTQVESPAFESMELLTKKSGEEIKKQIFNLEKKGSEEFGLRFDITIPLTRMFIARQKELPKPVKWMYISRMWRYEAPQRGRLREFYQFGIEIFGSSKTTADAEVIQFTIDALQSLGLKDTDIVVKLNSRPLLEGLVLQISNGKLDEIIRIIDKSKKINADDFVSELKGLGLDDEQISALQKIITIKGSPKEVFALLEKLDLNELAQTGLRELKDITSMLPEEFVIVDVSVARGLAYYTGIVFEVFDREEKMRSVAAGGRYDKLVELFGGEKTPATGVAIGLETTSLLLEEKELFPLNDLGCDYYIAPVNDAMRAAARSVASCLRPKNIVQLDLMSRSLTKQLDYAQKIGAKKVIIVGEEEYKTNEVVVKDMISRKEVKVKVSDL